MENIEIIRADSNYIDIISNGTFYRLIKGNYYYKMHGYYSGYVYRINSHIKTFNIPAYIDLDDKRFWIYMDEYAADDTVNLEEFTIDKNNKFDVVINDVVYNRINNNEIFLTIYPKYKKEEEFVVPKNINIFNLKNKLFDKQQIYLKRVIYKNKSITFDIDESFNKINYRIKQWK